MQYDFVEFGYSVPIRAESAHGQRMWDLWTQYQEMMSQSMERDLRESVFDDSPAGGVRG